MPLNGRIRNLRLTRLFSKNCASYKGMIKNRALTLKICIICSSLGGVLLSLFFARADGYSHWEKRLFYFTAQSNIWLGTTLFLILLLPFKKKNAEKQKFRLYLLRYIFTVSITITGIVFCFLLAPFSDKSYRPWTFCNLLTHVFAPLFAIADFFIDEYRIDLRGKRIFLPLLPPLLYFAFASILGIHSFDFGRGNNYPYFFLHHTSPAGIFGFSHTYPFYMGSFYWIFLFSLAILAISYLYAKWNEYKKRQTS